MKKIRLAFNFSEEDLAIMNRLAKATGTNRPAVVKMALKLCSDALDNTFSHVGIIGLGLSRKIEFKIRKSSAFLL